MFCGIIFINDNNQWGWAYNNSKREQDKWKYILL